MKNMNIDLKSIKSLGGTILRSLRRYSAIIMFLVLTCLYGFVIMRINTLSNPVVSETDILAEAQTVPILRIDESAAQKLQSLKDNSVNVQTLFEQNRTNPFDE